MDELCKLTGAKQKLSTAYHPQTDGNTEVLNQYIDQRLRPFVNHFQDNWSDLLPAMDFAQAILPHESTGLARTSSSSDTSHISISTGNAAHRNRPQPESSSREKKHSNLPSELTMRSNTRERT
jgi:hypothetical protein